GGNGYGAAVRWLSAEGYRIVSLRDRFDTLPKRRDLPPRGNLLLVTLPAIATFRTDEFVPLDQWLRAGNTLFVLAALADAPDWALRMAGLAPSDLSLLTGLDFQSLHGQKSKSGPSLIESLQMFSEPQRTVALPNREHAYFRGVRSLVGLSDYVHQSWAVKVPYEGFALELAHERDSGAGVLWSRPFGNGRIIVSGFGSLFTNRAIGLEDNAALLANVVATSVTGTGAVLFDDAHQGLGAAYDPQKFYRDSRLHWTLAILLALWLVWVLGSTRLRVPSARARAPREADLMRASGGFLARVLTSDQAARRMYDNFVRRLLARLPDESGASAWTYLERHPRVAASEVEQLQRWYADACAGRRVPLPRLHNLLIHIGRQIDS
ncbi:MAG TPA: DUF4350 domain-containing protein, partial [Polyangiales bacterium]|nr:DUF4350 domain-containing protein [Polyangiales bacterium]